MINLNSIKQELYRIWIVRPENWSPRSWRAVPIWHTALEPMGDELLGPEESLACLRAMNEQLREQRSELWGVRVPVRLTCQGDLETEQRFLREGCPGRESWQRANGNSRIFPNFANRGGECA